MLDKVGDGVGRQRALAGVGGAPRRRRVRVGERVADDEDEVAVGPQRLQEAGAQQVRRRLLEEHALRRVPVRAPLGLEARARGGRRERVRLRHVRERVERKVPRPAERVVGREDRLHVLPLVLELGRHLLRRAAAWCG
jgi:hypothetical protein